PPSTLASTNSATTCTPIPPGVVGQRPDAQRAQTAQLPAQGLGGHCQVVDLVWCCQDWSFVAIAARYKGYRWARGVAVSPFHAEPARRRGPDARPRRRGHLRDDPVLVCQ